MIIKFLDGLASQIVFWWFGAKSKGIRFINNSFFRGSKYVD